MAAFIRVPLLPLVRANVKKVTSRGISQLKASECVDETFVTYLGQTQRNNLLKYSSTHLIPSTFTGKSKNSGSETYETDSSKYAALFLLAFSLPWAKKKEEEGDKLITTLKRAKLNEYKNELDKATTFYHEALGIVLERERSKEMPDDKVLEAKIHIYDHLANIAMARHKFDDAEKLFKETMKGLLQKGVSANDNAVIEISLKLSIIYAMQRKIEEADKGYKYCLDAQEAKLEDVDDPSDNDVALLGMCVNSYSRFLMVRNRLEDAQVTLEKALKIAIRVFKEPSPQVAVLYNDLATIASMRKNYKLALEKVLKAIKIGKEIESEDLPVFLCNMGSIYSAQNDYKQARRYCQDALKLAKKMNHKLCEQEATICLQNIEIQKKESEDSNK